MNILMDTALGICHRETTEYGQDVDVVRHFIDESPSRRHGSARALEFMTWREAFSCEH